MRKVLCGLLLVFATGAFAQQQAPSSPPPHITPQSPERPAPQQQSPPDMAAPVPEHQASAQIGQQIQDKLDAEPALASSNVKANVNDAAVILTGTVNSERQHEMAVRIAQSYAGGRQILDRIEVKGHA